MSRVRCTSDGELHFKLDRRDKTLLKKGLKFREEEVGVYEPFGFGFPEVRIGDVYGDTEHPSYTVVRKLGFGTDSSVWLVKNGGAYSVMKILSEEATDRILTADARGTELKISEKLAECVEGQDGTPGQAHIANHTTHFMSANGRHLCLVSPDLGTSLFDAVKEREESGKPFMPISVVKELCRQSLLALEFLHTTCRIVHCDFKTANLLIRSRLSTDEVTKLLQEYPQQHYSDPAYTLRPYEELQSRASDNPDGRATLIQLISDWLKLREPPEDRTSIFRPIEELVSMPLPRPPLHDPHGLHIMLFDFGHAQFLDHQVTNHIMPLRVRAPEIILGLPWNEKVDIWAFGCVLVEWLTAEILTSGVEPENSANWDLDHLVLLSLFTESDFPPHMLNHTTNSNLENVKYWLHPREPGIDTTKDAPNPLRLRLENWRDDMTKGELNEIMNFLLRCLTLDPHKRPSARELLNEHWLHT